jgi:23S rRNA (cytidine1920-2'-O)/16S rRNA (cytidine1409-2'-O)-methyltransferase
VTRRLDAELAARSLARSRTHAAALIADGLVSVDGRVVVKASTAITDGSRIEVAGADHYVSRAAHKLLAGLDAFGLVVDGRLALDLGASTGGFTQVLLERGARQVLALDVGHDQLSPLVARDERVVSVEGVNARYLDPGELAAVTGVTTAPDVVTADLSFISLTHVLPAVASVAASDADVIVLVKPQFEVGRTAVKGGLVTHPALRAEALETVLWAAFDSGLRTNGIVPSPIAGTHGNLEYVVWLTARFGGDPSRWRERIAELTGT